MRPSDAARNRRSALDAVETQIAAERAAEISN